MELVIFVAVLIGLGFLTRNIRVPAGYGEQTHWPQTPEILRLCWADRIAMVWAVIVVGGIMLLQGGDGVSQTAMPAYGELLTKIVAPVWIFLRLLDLITGGPRRRKAARALREGAPPPWREDPKIQVLPPERPISR